MNDANSDPAELMQPNPLASSTAETASAAVAAQATAAVQARYVMAVKAPRNWDQVRTDLLRECQRTGFARVALYHKPIGAGIEGPSIRFVEAALRLFRNVLVETPTIFDDDDKRIVRVSVTDLESNTTYHRDVTVTKRVERRKLQKNQSYLGTRTNSRGETIYIVPATDDDILNKEGALVSKAIRTLGLRILPGDLVDEAVETVRETLQASAAKDPDAERKRLVDAFVGIGVQPAMLVEYLGHDLGRTTPADLAHLRAIYSAIKDGEATWADIVDEKFEGVDAKTGEVKETKTSQTLEKLKTRREGQSKSEQTKGGTKPAPSQEQQGSTGACKEAGF